MTELEQLKNLTENFFQRHWGFENDSIPEWSEKPWNFNNEIPSHNKRGCYALFSKGLLIYLGVAISQGSGNYLNHGLGDRLKRYWKLNKNSNDKKYEPSENWKEIDSIFTIGFEDRGFYLAAALEVYLIKELTPLRNKIQKPTAKSR